MRWYVLQVYSGSENSIRRSLEEQIKRNSLEEHFGQILVPSEEVVEVKNGKRRRSERKFFPSYVLIQMDMTEAAWHLVNSIPKTLGFVGGTKEKPLPISDKEAEAILLRVQDSSDNPKPKVIFEPGEEVRITDGAFKDFNGIVEEVNYEKSRLRVAVSIFGRSTPVDTEFGKVEKL